MSAYLAGNFNGFGMLLGLAVLAAFSFLYWLIGRAERAHQARMARTHNHDTECQTSPYGDKHHD